MFSNATPLYPNKLHTNIQLFENRVQLYQNIRYQDLYVHDMPCLYF